MPKYKLRIPPKGDYLYADGDYWFIGDTPEEAFEFFRDEGYAEEAEWVHPLIIRGHVVYKRDVDSGDCHEDAEPGDTTFTIVTEHSEDALCRALLSNEVLAWVEGPWRPWWSYGPYSGPGSTWDGKRWEASVGRRYIGTDFPTREAAKEAVEAEVERLVQVWKDTHPEFYRALPEEPDADLG